MKLILMHVGRIFLALYFLIPGISKFTSWNTSVALMEAHNMKMIPFLLAIAGIAQVVGSISLLLNRYVVICALGFAMMTLLINFNLHDFWNTYEGVNSDHELQNFYKNLGIFAGLLLLAAVNMEQTDKSE
jgi:putative oxidoreductase|tara:strand:- start:842 stop:1231 length:390 start_codon:yes stop_codon:yes gene_type:complete